MLGGEVVDRRPDLGLDRGLRVDPPDGEVGGPLDRRHGGAGLVNLTLVGRGRWCVEDGGDGELRFVRALGTSFWCG